MDRSLLYIPDISGFTKFVNATEVAHSQHVISELLELIIDSDELGLTVAEIEGDAVLFYHTGEPPSLDAVVQQTRRTFEAFHTHLKKFETHRICDCGACHAAHELTLKVVAHVGPIQMLEVRGFRKPYGSDVILAHRLLKNDVPDDEYLLVTPSVSESNQEATPDASPADEDWVQFVDGVGEYDEIGRVDFRYAPLTPLRAGVPDPPPPPRFEKTDNPVVVERYVDRPPYEVYDLVSNFDVRLTWSQGVDELDYDKDRVNRVGTRHNCVVGGNLIEFETITDDFGENRLVYGERIEGPPVVRECATYWILEPEGSGTRVRLEGHYQPRPFPQSLLAPLFRFNFKRQLPKLLNALKDGAEAQSQEEASAPVS